ncbi:hypothetical protein MSIMFB_03266 [Mycobacterium simulans]|uniref:Immunity protein 35 domain-containing protein n=1 Tax=Mycobacterium simulans TaxID=627089 RepID=A0A7Z7NBB9_9MYCO|nr:YrhB family protein [Mycobacterium simulans]SOJ55787.1 hypothetical protein MSIMFB_03266 [Mycobacterium simulans]
MNKIDFDEARRRAIHTIRELAEKGRLSDLMIVDMAIVETQEAWYFPYDAVAFVLNGDISAALAGNVPVKVPKDGSALTYEAPK